MLVAKAQRISKLKKRSDLRSDHMREMGCSEVKTDLIDLDVTDVCPETEGVVRWRWLPVAHDVGAAGWKALRLLRRARVLGAFDSVTSSWQLAQSIICSQCSRWWRIGVEAANRKSKGGLASRVSCKPPKTANVTE